MASENNRVVVVSCCIFVLVAIMHMLNPSCVEARVVQKFGLMHKGTVKSIEGDNGDMIDCVDIYKQPAFDDPLIKDLQMEPSSYPSEMEMEMDDSLPELIQDWHKNGECPEGTIPIRRDRADEEFFRRSPPFHLHGSQLNQSLLVPAIRHEYALVTDKGGRYHGGQTRINTWNPKTEKGEFSLAQMWVIADQQPSVNTIEAGWIVYPGRYLDSTTRFFIYWTRDYYRSTGCYDLSCSGFVQTNRKFAIGSPIAPISTYNGQQYSVTISMYKDKNTGNWWLQFQGVVLGYWPSSVIPGLASGATSVSWGGEVLNSRPGNHHTTTQMGSGHFSSEGFAKSSYIRNLKVIDSTDTPRDPGQLVQVISDASCYDLRVRDDKQTPYGTHFYYGGSGFSAKCQ